MAISTVFNYAKLGDYKKHILYPHSRSIYGLLAVSLASVFILDHYSLWSDNMINAFTEVSYLKEKAGENLVNDYLSYYGSIFSNLSRGLPINEGFSSTEPLNEQEEAAGAIEDLNPIEQEPSQVQESQPNVSNNSQ